MLECYKLDFFVITADSSEKNDKKTQFYAGLQAKM